MLNFPTLGTAYQTEKSNFQVTLVDKTDKNKTPLEYLRINRFFDNLNDRNTFVRLFESSINKAGGKLVHNTKLSHPLFESFNVIDKQGNQNYEITIYH